MKMPLQQLTIGGFRGATQLVEIRSEETLRAATGSSLRNWGRPPRKELTQNEDATSAVDYRRIPRRNAACRNQIGTNLTSSDWKLFAELGPTSKEGTDAK